MPSFLILTPLLILPIFALLKFVGCYHAVTLTPAAPSAPTNLSAIPGDNRVSLTWDAYTDPTLIRFGVQRGTISGNYTDTFSSMTNSFVDNTASNGTTFFYAVLAVLQDGESALSNEVSATPAAAVPKPFVKSIVNGSVHNDFPGTPGTKGLLGMRIVVGASDLLVSQLGRNVLAGNSDSHVIKIVDESTNSDLGAVTVQTAGQTPDAFVFGSLTNPVLLKKNSGYYIVSEETAGGDTWKSSDTVVVTEPDAAVPSAVLFDPTADAKYDAAGGVNNCYVPLNFLYVLSA